VKLLPDRILDVFDPMEFKTIMQWNNKKKTTMCISMGKTWQTNKCTIASKTTCHATSFIRRPKKSSQTYTCIRTKQNQVKCSPPQHVKKVKETRWQYFFFNIYIYMYIKARKQRENILKLRITSHVNIWIKQE
jgi:hypothetical protein